MTTTTDGLWAKVSVDLHRDPAYRALDAPARLVFRSSIGVAKGIDRDGEVTVGDLIGAEYPALSVAEIETAVIALVDSGLFIDLGDDRLEVRSFTKWNGTRDARAARKRAHQRGAAITNHKRGAHDTNPDPMCDLCNPTSDAQPNGQATVQRTLSARSTGRSSHAPSSLETETETETETEKTPDHVVSDTQEGPADAAAAAADAEITRIADTLIETLGYLDETATEAERRYVARALSRGWTRDDLYDVAAEAAGRDDVDNVRQWLGGCLRRRANTNPPDDTDTDITTPSIDPDRGMSPEVPSTEETRAAAAAEYWARQQADADR